jgi:folylpolyglutamate synthase/dihydropteroate synthase
LVRFLKDVVGRFDLIFGALTDKEISTFLPSLAQGAGKVILTSPTSSRAVPADRLAPFLPGRELVIEPDPEAALLGGLEEGDDPLVICGSVYLVGEIRTVLRHRFGLPEPAAKQPSWSRQAVEVPSSVEAGDRPAGP